MDWLQFIAKMAEVLVWPAAVLYIIYLLRKPITDLVPLLERMRYKDFEMEFGRRVEEARDEAEVDLPRTYEPEQLPSPEEQRILTLAEVSPRAAVIEAWRWIELAALNTANKLLGDEFSKKTMTFQAMRKLEKDSRVDRGAVSLMRELRSLRNDAAHAPEFALSRAAALEYADTARSLVGYLRDIGAPINAPQRTQ